MRFSSILILFLLALLFACGPKEIGQGVAEESGLAPEATGADMLRLPMTGMNNTQKMLYWQNHPDVMANVQKWRAAKFRRQIGAAISPEDPEYREIPKQRSPFRQ